MEKPPKSTLTKKRKRKSNTKITTSQPKNVKLDNEIPTPVLKKSKKNTPTKSTATQKTPLPNIMYESLTMDEIGEKYPILKDKELVAKFLKVPFTNNQKGRIRQAVTLQLKSSNDHLNPDAIHGKIQAILKSSSNLTDSELRRIRILYNMLNTTITKSKQNKDGGEKKEKKEEENGEIKIDKPKKDKPKQDKKKKEETEGDTIKEEKKEQLVKKVKGPKRYVVFVGNLPLGINKEQLLDHFSEFRDQIKDVRLPKESEGKKSAFAFIELADEPTYELALSKHHTMLMNKRIKVLYSMQKNSKISKSEAKSKSAKLIALQKSGKLLGSVPLAKKRSQRRLKMKTAKAAASAL